MRAPRLLLLLLLLTAGCEPEAPGGAPAPSVAVDTTPPPCRIQASEPAVRERLATACRLAATGLEALLAHPMPTGAVVVAAADTAPDPAPPAGAWVMRLPPREVPDAPLGLGAGRRISAVGYLTHEVAHRMATAYLFPIESDATPVPGYGSPLPDWLDEALAMLVEPEADRRARLSLLFEGETIYALPLRRLLYMSHPALAGVPAAAPLRRIFYAQSLAFALFVRERAGVDGLRRLVAELRAEERQGRALTSVPGLPSDGGELESEWLEWLREQRPAMRAAAPQRNP